MSITSFTVARRNPRSDVFTVSFRATPQHPAGLYTIRHDDRDIGRMASMPGLDDCERALATAGITAAQRMASVAVPVNKFGRNHDTSSANGGNKGGRGYQLKKILREVFE